MTKHPLKACREARRLEITDLRRSTKISVGRLEQIEAGRGRPVTSDEAKLLGRALNMPAANFLPMSFASCSELDLDEDEILSRDEDA